jgi:8-oxo-dGTP diphosphatase
MKRVDVAYACIKNKENQILMVYNQDAGHWSMPGGKVEQGEFLDQALVREVKEETGYDVSVGDVLSINERKIVASKEHALFLTFSCEILGGEILISDPKEISKVEWIDFDKANALMPYHPQGVKTLMMERIKYTNQGKY